LHIFGSTSLSCHGIKGFFAEKNCQGFMIFGLILAAQKAGNAFYA
jgi:hypothetical protein